MSYKILNLFAQLSMYLSVLLFLKPYSCLEVFVTYDKHSLRFEAKGWFVLTFNSQENYKSMQGGIKK